NIEDIIALIALYRPGPMGSGMLDDFVSRKHGKTKVSYDHPLLEPILKDTYGVILYQEQVMRIATDLVGFSAGQADGLRKAMGKKIPEEIEKLRENFINGAKAKHIDKYLAEKTFENIAHFGGYGFNKSHAGAYAMVSYRTAYLKANYPLQYMTALLNSEIGHSVIGKEDEESKLVGYIQDSEKMGIKILPPDVQKSMEIFSIEGKSIRFGLTAVKNVGGVAAENIVATRKKDGSFASWDDLINKIDPRTTNRKTLESLIKAGAFDSFGESYTSIRAELMTKLDKSLSSAGSRKSDADRGQGLLFQASEMSDNTNGFIKFEPWSEHDALLFEKEVLGFYLSGHPLAQHQRDLIAYSQYRLDNLPPGSTDPRSGPLIRVAGMITNAKKLITKAKKEQYARFKLEDLHGQIEVVVFPKSYKNGLSKYININEFVVVKGRLSGRDDGNELLAEEILSIDEAKKTLIPYSKTIHLKLTSAGLEEETLDKLKSIISEHPGKSPVVLDISTPGDEYLVKTDMKAKYSDKFFQEIEQIIGPDSWEMRPAQN
ncbi:DNA polymerase III subunit alpha, partial [Elusimicrobiota bacterium]